MNGTASNASSRAGPAPPAPAPASAPPQPPNSARPSPAQHAHTHNHVNGHNAKPRKKNDAPVDPATMYESLKNRIAALEEEEVLEEEEEKRFGPSDRVKLSHSSHNFFSF
jgi:hypothetical protein